MLATGHGNLVLVVELLSLSEKLKFSLNEAVRVGVSDLYPSSGNFKLLIMSQDTKDNFL